MRKRYQFKVNGLPPKKDGANTMWDKEHETERLMALREVAFAAIQDNRPLCRDISLYVTIHHERANGRHLGDLDNFVTGICDGLMAANTRCKFHGRWDDPLQVQIHPTKTVAIRDDSEVMEINARKVIGDTQHPWYEITLEGEDE